MFTTLAPNIFTITCDSKAIILSFAKDFNLNSIFFKFNQCDYVSFSVNTELNQY